MGDQKMESKSSANFQNLNLDFAEVHNQRHFVQDGAVIEDDSKNINLTSLTKDYYIEKEKEFFIKGGNGAKKTVKFKGLDFDKIFNEIKQNYKNTTGKSWEQRKGPRVGKSEIFKEMVINTKSTTSIDDIKKLKINLEKLGIKVLTVSIHNDEGHIKKDGTKKHNFHAHLIFANVNYNGIYKRWQKSDLMALQSVVADSLGMERGEVGSKAKRLSAREYKATQSNKTIIEEQAIKKISKVIENIEDQHSEDMRIVKILRNEITELKTKNKELTKTNNENFDKLSDIQQLFNALGLNEISAFVKIDDEKIKKAKEIIEANYKKQREELKASGIATQQMYSDAKLTKDKNVEIINSYSKNKKDKQIDIG